MDFQNFCKGEPVLEETAISIKSAIQSNEPSRTRGKASYKDGPSDVEFKEQLDNEMDDLVIDVKMNVKTKLMETSMGDEVSVLHSC